MPEICLTLICPPDLEERLLDWLLLRPDLEIFTSQTAFVHGLPHSAMNSSDKVMGRVAAPLVQAIFPAASQTQLIADLRAEFAGMRLRYWLTPVIHVEEIAF
ncbi:DUF3240 domain-containing protein [Betaproteobacteria bacterium SCN2]|jgi:hypothetical protein|nr:DUF3240 domain-containing protein [Betaproteobacteria bacterium SCN2]